jgi:hypothetical protein
MDIALKREYEMLHEEFTGNMALLAVSQISVPDTVPLALSTTWETNIEFIPVSRYHVCLPFTKTR